MSYLTDGCGLFRWVHCNPSAYTYFVDYKYELLCEEVSLDGGETWQSTSNTKLSEVGVADKKIKITFDNGDVFGSSCGSDDGVWYSFPTNDEILWTMNTIQHTTNLKDNERNLYYVYQGSTDCGGHHVVGNQIICDWSYFNTKIKNVKKLSFSDCVFEIGSRYRQNNYDVAESGQEFREVNHSFLCNNGRVMSWRYGTNQVLGSGWKIEELELPNTLKWIGGRVFADNNIKTLTLPSSVESIGYLNACESHADGTAGSDCTISGTFAFNTRLQNLNLNEGLKSIGTCDFMYCTTLEKVEIPSTLEGLGDGAFSGCTNLKQVIFKSSTPPNAIIWERYASNYSMGINSDTIVYVPCGSKSNYEGFASDVPSERIVEYGGNCGSIPEISSTYRTIATYKVGNDSYNVYNGLSGDTTVFSANTQFFDDNLKTYGNGICNGYQVDEVIVKPCVKCVGYASYPNGNIESTWINGTTKLTYQSEQELLYFCTTAKNIEIESSPRIAASFGFYNDGQQSASEHYLYGGNNIESVTFGSGCTSYVIGSFNKCANLSAVTINGNITLNQKVFQDCQNLTDVYINYSGNVISVTQGTTSDNPYPFYGTNARIHVPCELFDVYNAHSFWGNLNIVRDVEECEQ